MLFSRDGPLNEPFAKGSARYLKDIPLFKCFHGSDGPSRLSPFVLNALLGACVPHLQAERVLETDEVNVSQLTEQ